MESPAISLLLVLAATLLSFYALIAANMPRHTRGSPHRGARRPHFG